MYVFFPRPALSHAAVALKPPPVLADSALVVSPQVDQIIANFDPDSALTAVLNKISLCESGNDPLAKSKTSSAKGLFQIIDGTWQAFSCTGNVLNADDNRRCAVKIATTSGLQHWDSSKFCWNK